MATYFHGPPEIQTDGLQTLYLMNPTAYIGYTDNVHVPAAANMLLFNSSATFNSINPLATTIISQEQQDQQPQHQQQQQNYVGVPLQESTSQQQQATIFTGTHYNMWNPIPAKQQLQQQQQQLSLSLSPQQATHNYPPADGEVSIAATASVPSLQSAIMGSKYLKAAQQLLDEVVNVGKGTKSEPFEKAKTSKSPSKRGGSEGAAGDDEERSKRAPVAAGGDLSTAERQELQMKKAKLVNMLDEVEQRYRQYRHQMQTVVSAFEAVVGPGSAKTYTALALQTISRQFRCLRDAITGQIRAAGKSLGEEDCLAVAGGSKSEGGCCSKLRFVDHHLRQQRALQQLGMIQHNAWRPQRGLPERSVSILRAWLFEHFLHPYPKDSDKLMLAKQAGLTRSQVSNWFINARVRLWKPMVEEMYLEEVKQQEQSIGENDNKSNNDAMNESNEESMPKQNFATEQTTDGVKQKTETMHSSRLVSSSCSVQNPSGYSESQVMLPPVLKKARSDEFLHPNATTLPHSFNVDMKSDSISNSELLMKFEAGRQTPDEGSSSFPMITTIANHGGGFNGYSIGDMGRFDHDQFASAFSSHGVSLTLGLKHSESLSLPAAQPTYLSTESIPIARSLDIGIMNNFNAAAGVAQPSVALESINTQNRKRFAAVQLLPDIVS